MTLQPLAEKWFRKTTLRSVALCFLPTPPNLCKVVVFPTWPSHNPARHQPSAVGPQPKPRILDFCRLIAERRENTENRSAKTARERRPPRPHWMTEVDDG
jgi:hypothetical protein